MVAFTLSAADAVAVKASAIVAKTIFLLIFL
jgi:hypothetical protein